MQNDKDSIVFEKLFQLLFYFILFSALSEKLQITKIEFLKNRNSRGSRNYLVHWFSTSPHFPRCWFSSCTYPKVVRSHVSQNLTCPAFKLAWKPQNKKPSNPGDEGSTHYFQLSLMKQHKANE